MSRYAPDEEARREIVAYVYQQADLHSYLERTRPENTAFMEKLIKDSQVGGRLCNYMPVDKVKTYIKDAILNRYAKDRKILPHILNDLLASVYPAPIEEQEYDQRNKVSLHKVGDGRYLVVARATWLKWETGLRKIVLFLSAAPHMPPREGTSPELVLVIFQHSNEVNNAEKQSLECSLALLNVRCLWG